MATSVVAPFPPELLFSICAAVFNASLPVERSVDPLILKNDQTATALPSTYPPAYWPEPLSRKTLANLCLVNHAFNEAAKPWLWRRVEVRLPQSWVAFVEEVTGGDFGLTGEEVEQSIKEATEAAMMLKGQTQSTDPDAAQKLHDALLATLSGPDGSVPPELLTPPVSREPSPGRLRAKSKSPVRWKIMRSITDAVRNVMDLDSDGLYVPTLQDLSPGRHVRHLDFNHFRTIGMRRSVGEGVHSRFVTGERLENVLKELPNLTAFGATEYMDGALVLPVLQELFLRGSPSRGRSRPSRGRSPVIDDPAALEEEERERRRDCRELVAVDFTGCVSAVFVNALAEFVHMYLIQDQSDVGSEGRGREDPRFGAKAPLTFPGLQRLSLRGVKSVPSEVMNAFVLALPSLTHLDLSGTRVTSTLLEALADSNTIRLRSLALARCIRLSGDAITDFLIESEVAHGLTELSLYGDATFASALSEENLHDLIEHAPAFLSGNLRYLDLSSSPLSGEHLRAIAQQPNLVSLGLSYIPELPLQTICDFLLSKASNVEVLSIISTAPELGHDMRAREVSMAIHAKVIQQLCTPPFRFSLSLPNEPQKPNPPPTSLRVIELSIQTLNLLGAGAGSWRIIRSKGGRGWYVDTASGWVAEDGDNGVLRRDLPRSHMLRHELEKLADANGNVNSGVGWHARKMEILHGNGLLGREDGLYGAVSFAYQG